MHKLYFLLASLFIGHSLFSQQATASGAGTGQAGNIILDWSIGELTLVNTAQNGPLVFTQGLLQGKLLAFPVSSGIQDGELIVYPNPTPGELFIQTGFLQAGKLSLQLYDATGRLLVTRNESVNIFGTSTMSLLRYANGIYMLHALFVDAAGKTRKRTYKIVKAQ